MNIRYFNRHNNKIEIEKVYGAKELQWLYGKYFGKLLSWIFTQFSFTTILYGFFQNLPLSRNKIPPFIKKFNIPIEDFLPHENRNESRPYASFNEFFIRRFKPNKRVFHSIETIMPAFCEARYYGYKKINSEDEIPVKNDFLNPKKILNNPKWEETFKDGPLLLARLCPVDYHRFHYPDDGKVLANYKINGFYDSVNPIALKNKKNIFSNNVREITILETKNFGKLAYIEVGAICVGRIIQTSSLKSFNRGEEKGYFLFGGSTVILIGEANHWCPSEDILKNTSQSLETYLHLGTEVATMTFDY